MAKPTHEDADLMLRLVQSWPMEAGNWIHSDEFIRDYSESEAKYPHGSEGFANISAMLNWFETIGTLHKHGLFNEELLFDWLAVDHLWDQLKGHALGRREQSGFPRLYENFERMANAQREWEAARDREAA